MITKQHLQDLVSQGKLAKALKDMVAEVERHGDKDLCNTLLLLSARFNRNEKSQMAGVIALHDYNIENNRITKALLDCLEEYGGAGDAPTYHIPEEVNDNFIPLIISSKMKPQYQNKNISALKILISQGVIVLVTATETETAALHQKMQHLDEGGIWRISKENATYYCGKFGVFTVVHVECGTMGSATSQGAIMTVNNAISHLQPKFVLMVGIAFGVNPDKQNIGDVLVSKMLIPYEIAKIKVGKIEWRGSKPEANNLLRNRFRNYTMDWEYILPNDEKANLSLCSILTGEKLIDDYDYRQELQTQFPDAEGGEMEGGGVYVACHDKNIPWIVVKSICDFADGKKAEGKKEKQALAIDTAVSACLHVFQNEGVFDELGISVSERAKAETINPQDDSLLDLLEKDIPALFKEMDKLEILDRFLYSRFKMEYQAGLKGIELHDWQQRIAVFIHGLS